MNHPHVAPGAHLARAKESLTAHRCGNRVHALTLAMMSGLDAAVLGLSLADCPRCIADRLELYQEWLWGFRVAVRTNDNQIQGSLL